MNDPRVIGGPRPSHPEEKDHHCTEACFFDCQTGCGMEACLLEFEPLRIVHNGHKILVCRACYLAEMNIPPMSVL